MIHSEDGATPLLSTAQRYLPSHSSSYRTIHSVPGEAWTAADDREGWKTQRSFAD